MPNIVNNWVEMEGDSIHVEHVFKFMKSDKRSWDFNCLIPAPKELLRGSGLSEWRRDRWGTSTNAIAFQKIASNIACFETAWEPPMLIFVELAIKFPDLKFLFDWIEEDTESAGCQTFVNGQLASIQEEPCSAWHKGNALSLIHSLNLKRRRDEYVDFLQDIDTEDARYYLSLEEGE